jgi:hypothetical protein
MMLREPTRDTDGSTKPTVRSRHVTADVWVPKPVEIAPITDEQTEEFTQQDFEGALDKVARPVKGKYADVPTSSEAFAARKQEEIDLEERRR